MQLKACLLTISVFFISQVFAEPDTTGLNLGWRNLSTSPKQDFYDYANGTWQKQNPIPPDYASWGPFYQLHENNLKKVHQILIDAAADSQAQPNSIERKVGDFYFSGMDEALINNVGVSPLNNYFQQIASIKNIAELQTTITQLQLIGVDALFNFGSMQDYTDSSQVIGYASQGGLGLPDRDYYLNTDKKFQTIRAFYQTHIEKMFELLGDNPTRAKTEASTVLSIETKLAKASMSQTAQRNPRAIYNLKNREELKQLMPNFSWPEFFTTVGQNEIKQINLAMPEFFTTINNLLVEIPLNDWKIYLRWHLINDFAPYLSQPFVNQNFKMNAFLTGTEKILPRWKQVVRTENSFLGFAVGKLYIDKYFSAAAKKEVSNMVQSIRQSLEHDLKNISWMTPKTREAALKKLALMKDRVGYPDKWWDYSRLNIDRGPYVLNILNVNKFLVQRNLNKISKPVDREEWGMTPQTINAYYDFSMNNINLPAGILQPPFFDPNAPAAVNYGAIGFVIGHELTHGFDDQGAQFDGYGNLNNWWTTEDLKKFNAATHCIVEQYSQYKVNGDFPVQGKLVVGEATADLGGLTLAYRAFLESKVYKEAKVINGLSPEQQFFIGAAHVWAGNIRAEQARNNVMTDPHPPLIYRVNGTLANMPEFQAAFKIKPPSKMINQYRCVIW